MGAVAADEQMLNKCSTKAEQNSNKRGTIQIQMAQEAALQRGIFTHVCPLIFRKDTELPGAGTLLEASLTDDSFPGCPGARIITIWEA